MTELEGKHQGFIGSSRARDQPGISIGRLPKYSSLGRIGSRKPNFLQFYVEPTLSRNPAYREYIGLSHYKDEQALATLTIMVVVPVSLSWKLLQGNGALRAKCGQPTKIVASL
jgi:hypothetical protein